LTQTFPGATFIDVEQQYVAGDRIPAQVLYPSVRARLAAFRTAAAQAAKATGTAILHVPFGLLPYLSLRSEEDAVPVLTTVIYKEPKDIVQDAKEHPTADRDTKAADAMRVLAQLFLGLPEPPANAKECVAQIPKDRLEGSEADAVALEHLLRAWGLHSAPTVKVIHVVPKPSIFAVNGSTESARKIARQLGWYAKATRDWAQHRDPWFGVRPAVAAFDGFDGFGDIFDGFGDSFGTQEELFKGFEGSSISTMSSSALSVDRTLDLKAGAEVEQKLSAGRYMVKVNLESGDAKVLSNGTVLKEVTGQTTSMSVVVPSGSMVTVTVSSKNGAKGRLRITTEAGSCGEHADGAQWADNALVCTCAKGVESCRSPTTAGTTKAPSPAASTTTPTTAASTTAPTTAPATTAPTPTKAPPVSHKLQM
jgi:hypothetical protein